MGLVFCCVAAIAGFVAGQRSLGHGLGFVLAVGCIYGWLRCYFLDGFTHFTFDAALIGLYAASLPRLPRAHNVQGRHLRAWVTLLLVWPCVVILLSPLMDSQPALVQIVGLRNAVFFLPAVYLGFVLTNDDVDVLGAWCIGVVIVASVFAGIELVYGIERVFPMNSASKLIYQSKDVAQGQHRIPALFASAHAYGGTMVALLPFLLHRILARRRLRLLTFLALVLAALGVFVCGARSPVIVLGAVLAITVSGLGRRPGVILAVVVAGLTVAYLVRESARLQRFETLSDPDLVENRVSRSVNLTFFEVLFEYPMGKGLGSAVGTSIPFFLEDVAKPPVGIESEYSRIMVEEGLIGLALWVGFVLWCLLRWPGSLRRFGGATDRALWAIGSAFWVMAGVGTGALAAVPGSMMLLLSMGCVASQPRVVGIQVSGRSRVWSSV